MAALIGEMSRGCRAALGGDDRLLEFSILAFVVFLFCFNSRQVNSDALDDAMRPKVVRSVSIAMGLFCADHSAVVRVLSDCLASSTLARSLRPQLRRSRAYILRSVCERQADYFPHCGYTCSSLSLAVNSIRPVRHLGQAGPLAHHPLSWYELELSLRVLRSVPSGSVCFEERDDPWGLHGWLLVGRQMHQRLICETRKRCDMLVCCPESLYFRHSHKVRCIAKFQVQCRADGVQCRSSCNPSPTFP